MDMTDPWDDPGVVETYSGGGFDLFSPDPEDVRIRDIAAGLAHTCRFGGHCWHFYSVAHHSLHVSNELPADRPRLQLIGLLHDAGEAYLGDIPRPLKTKLDEFERLEQEILAAVWTALDIDPPTDSEWKQVMVSDDRLLAYEATHLLEGGEWADRSPEFDYDLNSTEIDQIRARFQSWTELLMDQIS